MRATNGSRRDSIPHPVASPSFLPRGAMALAAAILVQAHGAGAAEFSDGSTRINIDTTLSQGFSWRVSDRDDSLTGVNSDDGARNYDKGLLSNTSKFNTEFDIDNGEVGIFARFQGFIDFENRNGKRERTPLSRAAKGEVGDGLDVLDLYATVSFDIGDAPVDLRIGNQVLNWGESTFIQNGINVINPFDVSKLRKPGAELRDGLLPVPIVSVATDITPNLSIEGFYQAAWEETRVDPVGTYFSTNDYGTPGGRRAFVDLPGIAISDHGGIVGWDSIVAGMNADLGTNLQLDREYILSVDRGADSTPKDSGQGGLALRYYAKELNDTEFGFYFVNYHSRLPLASATYGSLAGYGLATQAATAVSQGTNTSTAITNVAQFVAAQTGRSQAVIEAGLKQLAPLVAAVDHFAESSRYSIEYPENLQVFGLSFNTALGTSGWALQGEYSFHPDQPLQRHENAIFADGLYPVTETLRLTAVAVAQGQTVDAADLAPLTAFLGTRLPGYIERNLSQVQATATRVFGPTIGADSFVLAAEAALVRVHGLPDRKAQPLDTPGSGKAATANSYGYRLATKLDYYNAIGPATVSPYLQFQHDVNGYSPSPGGPFEEGRTALTLGVGVNYLERWRGDLSYTNYNGDTNYLSDRDFVSLSMSYSF